jgi:hypothetical protein
MQKQCEIVNVKTVQQFINTCHKRHGQEAIEAYIVSPPLQDSMAMVLQMIKNLSEETHQNVFMVHIQAHGTHYGVTNESNYSGEDNDLEYLIPQSLVSSINGIVSNILHILPNIKFLSCGTCQTGQTLLYSSELPMMKKSKQQLPLNNDCGSYQIDPQYAADTILISAYDSNISITDVIWDAEVIIETLYRCNFDFIKTINTLITHNAISANWKWKLVTRDQVKHFSSLTKRN